MNEIGRLTHVFHHVELPAHEGSKSLQSPVEEYQETDEHVSAEDKKHLLNSFYDDVKVAQMEAHLKLLPEKFSAVKGRRMANEAFAAGAAAEAAKGEVIPVDDSLPNGRIPWRPWRWMLRASWRSSILSPLPCELRVETLWTPMSHATSG